MSGRCIREDELERVLHLPGGSAERRHAEGCARCRALLLDYQDFIAPPEAPAGADPAAAGPRLEQALAAELGRIRPLAERPPRPGGIEGRARAWWARPAWAAAATLLAASALYLALRPAGEDQLAGDALRADQDQAPARATLVTLPPATAEGGALVLSWRRFPGADAYEVRLHGDDLAELQRLGPVADTFLVLRAGALPPATRAGQTVGWRVAALRGGEEIAASSADLARLPGPLSPR